MKRIFLFALCLVMLSIFISCSSAEGETALSPGNYCIVGDYEEELTPYIRLSMDDNSFRMGAGSIVSYQEYGDFQIKEGKLYAVSQTTTFVFEIRDSMTLILLDGGNNEFFQLPENAVFVLCEDSLGTQIGSY